MLGRLLVVCVLGVLVTSEDDVRASDAIYRTADRITAEGYPVETHHVITPDGYILEMHRIPHGRSVENISRNRTVVFIMHGLLAASESFVILGAEHSMAYNLADAGFDIWMGNARGNKDSRNHVSLNPDDAEEKFQFFDFSFEEIGIYDLPAMIDYALEYTGQEQLHYIGHSQGGTAFLIMASMLPEYNAKISQVHLLAGVGYQEYFPNFLLRIMASRTEFIYRLALRLGIVELLPAHMFPFLETTSEYCIGDPQMSDMCQLLAVSGILRDNLIGTLAGLGSAGASMKQLAHYGQNIRDKAFRRYNFGTSENMNVYGSELPPDYNLSLITANVTMHYTLNDRLLDEKDVYAMAANMPNTVTRQVARSSFLHIDFIAALDVKELVTDFIIAAIRENEVESETVTSSTDPSIDATTSYPGSANTLSTPLNMCLILISLYMLLR